MEPAFRHLIPAVLILSALSCSVQAWGEISFIEVGQDFGGGPSFGASWGDRNGDGYPDLYVSNHATTYPSLYVNNGDGTFTATATGTVTDVHGGSWADFDNNATQDYLFQVGSTSGTSSIPNRFYVNHGAWWQEESAARGLDDPLGRGRTPLWVDWNNDGLLDIILSNDRRSDGQSPTSVFIQDVTGSFSRSLLQPTAWVLGGDYASVIHLADELQASVFVDVRFVRFWKTIYSPGEVAPRAVSASSTQLVDEDRLFADLDGDLMTDVVVTQHQPERSELIQISPSSIAAVMLMSDLNPIRQGATFRSPHPITIKLNGINPIRSHVGASGDNLPYSSDKTYTLDPIASAGITEPAAGDSGFYIGYEAATESWQFFVYSESAWYQVVLEVVSSGPIVDLVNEDIVDWREFLDARLFLWDDIGDQFIDATTGSGLDAGSPCQSIVAEDFDNDTDLDLYMTCTGAVENENNLLLENLGSGVFSPVPLAGGAQGTIEGRAQTVSSADYDLDGFVDVFVTNGLGTWPFNDGVNQLFRNVTANENHWIEIDLEGVDSNRDGIGALVTLTAGGVSQVRTRSGGMHKYAQNFSRLHFGLGDSNTVDSITVNWPTGIETYITDVPSDQVLTLIEVDVPEPSAQCMILVALTTTILVRRASGHRSSA